MQILQQALTENPFTKKKYSTVNHFLFKPHLLTQLVWSPAFHLHPHSAPIDSRLSKHHLLFGAMHGNQSVCVTGQEGCYSLLTATGGAEAAVATVTVWLVAIWLLNEAVNMCKAVEGACKMVSHPQPILFFDGSNDTIRISIFFPMLFFFLLFYFFLPHAR